MRNYPRSELRQLVTYRGESGYGQWALWTGELFIMHVNGEVVRLRHEEDDSDLPIFIPYKDPI